MSYGFTAPEQYGVVIGTGRKTVTAAGTPVQLGTTEPCTAVIIQCLKANTGNIMVGGPSAANCDITDSSEKGVELEPGQSMTLTVRSLKSIYLDSDTNGDGVSYILLG